MGTNLPFWRQLSSNDQFFALLFASQAYHTRRAKLGEELRAELSHVCSEEFILAVIELRRAADEREVRISRRPLRLLELKAQAGAPPLQLWPVTEVRSDVAGD